MSALPAMSETAVILSLILCIACIAIIGMIFALRRGPLDDFESPVRGADLKCFEPVDDKRPHWIAGIAVTLALVAIVSWASQRDERILAAERRADFETQLARLGCAPARDDDGPLVVLIIDSTADPASPRPARTKGCARVANKSWMWWNLASGEAPIYASK